MIDEGMIHMAIELQHTICKHCNTEPPEGAKFCPACGKRIPRPRQSAPDISDFIIRQVDPVLRVKEAAALLKSSEWMIYELVRQDRIPHFKIGNRVRFHAQELLEWSGTLGGHITTV